MLDRALQPSGLTTQDVEFKLMPYPDMLVAMANRSIEGAMELEPFIAQGAARGVLVRWKTGADLSIRASRPPLSSTARRCGTWRATPASG